MISYTSLAGMDATQTSFTAVVHLASISTAASSTITRLPLKKTVFYLIFIESIR